jgi:hypothetical protein
MFVDITIKDWAFAALLGEARRRSNDAIRKSVRDRGITNNTHVDLMGSISEIVAYKYFKPNLSERERASVLKGMFRAEGGGGAHGVDLSISKLSRLLDVKSFDCADNKRFFAINKSKHVDLSGKCDGYFCIICPKYSKKAFVVDYVHYADVSNWDLKVLGSYGDPSYNLSINDYMRRYAGGVSLQDVKRSEIFPREQISQEIKNENTRNVFYTYFPDTEKFLPVISKKAG